MPWPKGKARPEFMAQLHEQNRGKKRTKEQRQRISAGQKASSKQKHAAKIRGKSSRKLRSVDKRGRVFIWVGDKKVVEHRHIVEQLLGRPLEKYELVHHLNEDPTDNRPKNLLVMNRREHRIVHRAEQLVRWCIKQWPEIKTTFQIALK